MGQEHTAFPAAWNLLTRCRIMRPSTAPGGRRDHVVQVSSGGSHVHEARRRRSQARRGREQLMRTRVVVLGAGFGGLELATVLSDALGESLDLVLLDRDDAFVF